MTAIPLPHPTRLSPQRNDYAQIIAAHEKAVADNLEGYDDPTTGAFVLTVRTLEQRTFCCETGCRHCPFITD